MSIIANQISNWYTGQTVTASEMILFSQDVYYKFGALTQSPIPCIIQLDGEITQAGAIVTIPRGTYRFPDQANSQLQDPNTPIIGSNPDPATVNVTSPTGYIVARYTIDPLTSGSFNYAVNVTFAFTTILAFNDCVICMIAGGVISGYGNFLINRAATEAEVLARTSNSCALTPQSIKFLFPDIVDDASTGTVTIYGDIHKTGVKELKTDDTNPTGKIARIATFNNVAFNKPASVMGVEIGGIFQTGIISNADARPELANTANISTLTKDIGSCVFLEDVKGIIAASNPLQFYQFIPTYDETTSSWVNVIKVSGKSLAASGSTTHNVGLPTFGTKEAFYSINANFEFGAGLPILPEAINVNTEPVSGNTVVFFEWNTPLADNRYIRYEYTYLDVNI